MLCKNKEELNAVARIILNNIDELFHHGLLAITGSVTCQEVLESEDWIHVYNLIQRMAFINNTDPHFGVLAEIEALADRNWVDENGFGLRFHILKEGISFMFTDREGKYMYPIEIWSIDRSIQGLQLNMPSSVQ